MSGGLKALREQYEELLTASGAPPPSAELAKLEFAMWQHVRATKGRKHRTQRTWLMDTFGGGAIEYEIRAAIHRAGAWAYPIFDQIDRGTMSNNGARFCLRAAKDLIGDLNVNPSAAIEAVIAAYDGTSASVKNVKLEQPASEPGSGPSASKHFKKAILKSATDFAVQSMEGHRIEPVVQQRLLSEFKASIGGAVLDLLLDISRAKGEAKRDALSEIGAKQFRDACEVLGISARFGAPLDSRKVRVAYRRRAAFLQRTVDVAAGANDTSERAQAALTELQAVNAANELLRAYIRQRENGNA